jgi:hypothetical protein
MLQNPTTSIGVELLVVVPLPSSPSKFEPQHFVAPVLRRAQVCSSPALSSATPLCSPLTLTGIELLVVVPLPSSPSKFEPQHFAAPALVTAQV